MKNNLITSALVFALSLSAFANDNNTKLEEIQVLSAYGTPVNQDKTAPSVTVLTKKDFQQRNATYVIDVLRTVPGITFTANGGRGAMTNIHLRGAEANHTAVIIDGVKINPVSGDGVDFGGLSLSNIERIEVLRGEQSTLWGSNAMGGVIYITTKNGLHKDSAFNLDFDMGRGSKGTTNGAISVSGFKNGFYYALNGNSQRTDGISTMSQSVFRYTAENGKAFRSGGAKEKDRFHRDSGSVRFGYNDNDKGVEFAAGRASQSTRFDNQLADTLTDDKTYSREKFYKVSGFIGSDQALFKHQVSFNRVKTDVDNYGAWASNNVSRKRTANYQLDVNFDRDGYLTQAVSLLGEYQKADYKFGNYSELKKLNEKSVAAEYRLFTEDDHAFSLGARYIDNSHSKNAWTARAAGAYRLSEHFRLHASYGKAVQNPSIVEYYGWGGGFIGNPNLKAEKSLGGDVGLLIESANKRHSLDVTYFARNVSNYISSETVDPATYTSRAVNLDGVTKLKGVEIAYNTKITADLSAYANYTYTRGKNNLGVELQRRPKHVANVGVNYQVTDKIGTNLNLTYMGKRIDTYWDANYNQYRTKMPSYTLVNLGADYKLDKNISLYFNANNVFNKKHEQTIGYGQVGRNYYVGVKGSF